MSDSFIDAHFDEIRNHASDIESRLYDTNNTINSLKADNHNYIEGFAKNGEQVTLIDTDYDAAIIAVIKNE